MFWLFFLGFLHVFMMYSCSKSFRELKNAIKNSFFLYLRGLGGQIKFLIEKNAWGKLFGQLAFYTWVHAKLQGKAPRGHSTKAITQAWSPSSTYQQLLIVCWVPQQLLQKAVFDMFTFEGGLGGPKILN